MPTFPKISCLEALSAADAQPQATSTKLPCALLYMSLVLPITTRHMRCSAHMRFCTKRKIYSKLRYIIFAFAAELNSLPQMPQSHSRPSPPAPHLCRNRVHDAASSSGEVDLSPSIWPQAYTDSKPKRSGAAPQSTSLRLGDLVQIQIWPISHM
jgi:hypothetical protein